MTVFFSRRKPFWIFSLLILLFFGPLLLAGLFYAFPQLLPQRSTAHGVLLSPAPVITEFTWFDQNALPLVPAQLQKKWRIWYVTTQQCTQVCQANLVKLQQVQRALGKDQGRVELMFVRLNAQPTPRLMPTPVNSPVVLWQTAKANWVAKMGRVIDTDPALTATPEHIYLSDPLGNFMMVYPSSITQRFLYNDLKHLLKVSQIG